MTTCATCKWGRFEMTKHKPPRINRNRPGRCEWPMERVLLPVCATGNYPFKSAIWADDLHNCPTWEAK